MKQGLSSYAVAVVLLWNLFLLFPSNGWAKAGLLERWNINPGILSFLQETNTLRFDHGISNEISPANNARVEVFYEDCGDSLPPLVEGILYNGVDPITAEHVLQIDPAVLSQNDLVFDGNVPPGTDGKKRATMTLCLRYMLWTGPEGDATAIQANILETVLIIYFDLTKGFVIDNIQVENRDQGESIRPERDQYEIIAYICDPNTREQIPIPFFNQGEMVPVCLEVGELAIMDGVIIDYIIQFVWTRTFGSETVDQFAIDNGVVTPLASYECTTSGVGRCLLQTLPISEFYKSDGEVEGYGMAQLAFVELGRSLLPKRRMLEDRSKSEDPDFRLTMPVEIRQDSPEILRMDVASRTSPTLLCALLLSIPFLLL